MPKIKVLSKYLMPAEWERQESTWIAWPHNKSDWPNKFQNIPKVFLDIIFHLSSDQKVNILLKSQAQKRIIKKHLKTKKLKMKNIQFFVIRNNRAWIRDYGPIYVKNKIGKKIILNWKFNGWAKYKDFQRDNKVNYHISKKIKKKIVEPKYKKKQVVLEGGAIDVNGKGTLITTKECLLSKVQQRNPGISAKDYEEIFNMYLGIKKVIWLNKGLVGDDTHGHIDDVAKFVSENKIFINVESNTKDKNFKNVKENLEILKKQKNLKNNKFKIVKIPLPNPKKIDGIRVPASYINFYIANKKVLVPVFNDPKDKLVLKIFRKHFKKRIIIPIDCSDLIWGFGAVHCMTIQEPY